MPVQAETYQIICSPEWHKGKLAGCSNFIQSAQLRKSYSSTLTVLWCKLAAHGKMASFFLVVYKEHLVYCFSYPAAAMCS